MRIVKLTAESKKGLLEDLLQRSPNHYGQYESAVAEIIETVKKGGDEALFSYTEKFDHCKMDAAHIRVTREEIDEAYQKVDADFVEVMKKSAANIRAFHEKQLRNSWFDPKPDGTILGMKILPIAIAGVYVPGGKAAYPSSVLMNVLPAKVAGVERIIMTTPPGADGKVNPGTLVAAHIAGVDEIYKVGGAQAMGLSDCDVLAPGKQADLIVIDLQRPNMQPVHNAARNLVYSGSKENVRLTMIAGRVLYENGAFFVGEPVQDIYRAVETHFAAMRAAL